MPAAPDHARRLLPAWKRMSPDERRRVAFAWFTRVARDGYGRSLALSGHHSVAVAVAALPAFAADATTRYRQVLEDAAGRIAFGEDSSAAEKQGMAVSVPAFAALGCLEVLARDDLDDEGFLAFATKIVLVARAAGFGVAEENAQLEELGLRDN